MVVEEEERRRRRRRKHMHHGAHDGDMLHVTCAQFFARDLRTVAPRPREHA